MPETEQEVEVIGRCLGETSTDKVSFVSKNMPQVGQYVYLEYNDQKVIGMIESLLRGSTSMREDILNPDTIEKILTIEGDIDHYIKGKITIYGDVENLRIPRTPAPPGTKVMAADTELLREVFAMDNGLKIGTLLTQDDVEVRVNINKLVSRHLAVLAMTGAGKSNATSVIIDELLRVNGALLLFDMHGEYVNAKFQNGEVNKIASKINPKELTIYEYKKLASVPDNAVNQEVYLREVYDYAQEEMKDPTGMYRGKTFLEIMQDRIKSRVAELEDEEPKRKPHIDAATQVKFKLEDMGNKYKKILGTSDVADITEQIGLGKLNVINLNNLDETAMDILVNHALNEVLNKRKSGDIEYPIFSIIEEAHILASNQRDTRSKSTISKIAREGRKFGVGLCLVSQSPKNVDSSTLSQVNNMIILRLIEPGDQKHVQQSSESLSDDMLSQLPSLNIGEAVLLGQMTKLPTMVKIDEFKGKLVGNDPDALKEWANYSKEEKKEEVKQEEELEDMW